MIHNGYVVETCDNCGGEGQLFEQLDVDIFRPVSTCPECHGKEVVNILCEECKEPFTKDEWDTATHEKSYHYHERCCEE